MPKIAIKTNSLPLNIFSVILQAKTALFVFKNISLGDHFDGGKVQVFKKN